MAGKTLAAQRGEEGEEEITIIVPGDDAATHSKSAAAAGATTKRVALEYEFNQMEKDLIRRAQELMLGGAAVGALCFTFVGRSLYGLSSSSAYCLFGFIVANSFALPQICLEERGAWKGLLFLKGLAQE
ncbi:hypothetical protein QOT17_002714 [Balamuthia mandrillaris]